MDVLSDLLLSLSVRGTLFYNAEFSAPWSFRSPPSRALADRLGLSATHVVMYHLIFEGAAWAQLESGPRTLLQPGDIVMFPLGDAHLMGNGAAIKPVDNGEHLDEILFSGLDLVRMGGGGEPTRFLCGYIACEPHASPLLLAGLPRLCTLNLRDEPSAAWLEDSIRAALSPAGSREPGADAVRAKLSEALFAETLRRYIASLPPGQTGWLAGARDPVVGKALALLHNEPARRWTIADLAASVAVSRSVLAERFRQCMGEPPMSYLARWRLRLGSRRLSAGSKGVAQVAAEVGYDSEAAFNRAFKREFGMTPARYRAQAKSAGA